MTDQTRNAFQGAISSPVHGCEGGVATPKLPAPQPDTGPTMDDARAIIRQLVEAGGAMLTHMGMDEDEFNRATFNQLRAALAAAAPFLDGREG